MTKRLFAYVIAVAVAVSVYVTLVFNGLALVLRLETATPTNPPAAVVAATAQTGAATSTATATATAPVPTAEMVVGLEMVDIRCDGVPVDDAILYNEGGVYLLAYDEGWVEVQPMQTSAMINFRQTERVSCTFWAPILTCGEENFRGLTYEILRSLPFGNRPDYTGRPPVCQ